jgi:hypothetical protein
MSSRTGVRKLAILDAVVSLDNLRAPVWGVLAPG